MCCKAEIIGEFAPFPRTKEAEDFPRTKNAEDFPLMTAFCLSWVLPYSHRKLQQENLHPLIQIGACRTGR